MHEHVHNAGMFYSIRLTELIPLKLYPNGYDFYSFIVVVPSMLPYTTRNMFFRLPVRPRFSLDLLFILQYYVVKFTITDPNCFSLRSIVVDCQSDAYMLVL